jgi:hypothetical protein
MHINQTGKSGWRQIDAGLWVKPAPVGHVEIAFASDSDGSPLYEVAAFDELGRPTELPFEERAFGAFETARNIGDMLVRRSTEAASRGH